MSASFWLHVLLVLLACEGLALNYFGYTALRELRKLQAGKGGT